MEFSAVANDHQSPPQAQASAVTNATSQISTPKTATKNSNPNKATRKHSFGGNPAKSAANSRSSTLTRVNANTDETYGKDIKNIPKATWKLLTNKIYIVTCLVSCILLRCCSSILLENQCYYTTNFPLPFLGGLHRAYYRFRIHRLSTKVSGDAIQSE